MKRDLYDEEHEMFGKSLAAFIERHVTPEKDRWATAGIIDRTLFKEAGAAGFLCMSAPEEYGGSGVDDLRFAAKFSEVFAQHDAFPISLGLTFHSDILLGYFLSGTEEQRQRWVPGMVSGDLITALGMTEPGGGSDFAAIKTTAVRDGDDYVINGSKTFISNGINADLVIVAAMTDPAKRHKGMSLFVVERDMPGFTRGRNLDKLGQHAQDTAELFFDNVRVPAGNMLGAEGSGFLQAMKNLAPERLLASISALAHAEAAFSWTLDYVKERKAFGQPIGTFQNTRFKMAEMRTELDVARAYVDQQILAQNRGELSAEDAAAGKWWTTELEVKVIHQCLQFFGGYGYMAEYPIARAYADARIQTIYGGTTEIMKEIVGKSLGL